MHKYLFVLLIWMQGVMLYANDMEIDLSDFVIESNEIDPALVGNNAVFKLRIDPSFYSVENRLIYAVNNVTDTIYLDSTMAFSISVTEGSYAFAFYLNDQYLEIFTDSIRIEARHCITARINFSVANEIHLVRKPVIYLYPLKEMKVSVELNSAGPLLFTYPTYNDKWDVYASPNGDLKVNDKTYRYLFWESEQRDFSSNWDEGFILKSHEIVSFLEKTLASFGMTTNEQADFITYWAPQMTSHNACVLHFITNSNCDQFAELKIQPTPDALNRIYVVWAPIDNVDDFDYIRPQNIQSINRLGFTVLEWGGIELKRFPRKKEAL